VSAYRNENRTLDLGTDDESAFQLFTTMDTDWIAVAVEGVPVLKEAASKRNCKGSGVRRPITGGI